MCVFVYYSLTLAFIMFVFEKWGLTEFIQKLSVKYKTKALHKLSECNLCKSFWIGFPLTIPFSFIFGADWFMLLYPAMGTVIVLLIQKVIYS